MANSAQVQKLSHRHEAILHFMIANPTVPKWEIAAKFNVTQAWLSVVINSQAFQEAQAAYTDEAFHETVLPLRQKLMAAADAAVDRMNKLIPIETDLEVVRKTTDSVLEACGYSSPRPTAPGSTFNQQNNIFLGNASPEVLARARDRIGLKELPHVPEDSGDLSELDDSTSRETEHVAGGNSSPRRAGAAMEVSACVDGELVHDTDSLRSALVSGTEVHVESGGGGSSRADTNRAEGDSAISAGSGRERQPAGAPGEATRNSGGSISDSGVDDASLSGFRPTPSAAEQPSRGVEITVHGADW